MIHADEAISENCDNLYDSYGEICVQCNCCGKLNKDKMHECRIQTYKEHLMNIAKEYGFDVNEIKGE